MRYKSLLAGQKGQHYGPTDARTNQRMDRHPLIKSHCQDEKGSSTDNPECCSVGENRIIPKSHLHNAVIHFLTPNGIYIASGE